MQFTDSFHGQIVECVYRNEDGSITLCATSGKTLRMGVIDNMVQVVPPIVAVAKTIPTNIPETRLRMGESFTNEKIEYVIREDSGTVTFACVSGRQITLDIQDGYITDVPRVGCNIFLKGQGLFSHFGG